jgi:RHS repeat-associated protein
MSVTWSGGPSYGIKAFTGREWDPEIGLYYYRARYYDPKAGRFISEDPIGLTGGMNYYAYVGNQPIEGWDPLGLVDFSGDPELVRQAYAQQERLRSSLTPKVIDFFKQVYDADLNEYLTRGKQLTFELKNVGEGEPSGHCNPGYLVPLDPEPWINTSLNQFGNDGLLFRATLMHELAHLANRNDFWSGSYAHTEEATRKAEWGHEVNMMEGMEGYYAEVYQFGKVLTRQR